VGALEYSNIEIFHRIFKYSEIFYLDCSGPNEPGTSSGPFSLRMMLGIPKGTSAAGIVCRARASSSQLVPLECRVQLQLR